MNSVHNSAYHQKSNKKTSNYGGIEKIEDSQKDEDEEQVEDGAEEFFAFQSGKKKNSMAR